MNLAESIAAILAMHEGRMLRARVALLELAEELETSSPRGRPDLEEPSNRIRAIARELGTPTRDAGTCPDHPAAETLDVISCVTCGAWKPSKESPLVYIGSDGVHRAVRASSTRPPPPAPKCSEVWREDDGELARCDLEAGHAGAHHYRNVFTPPSEKASEDSLSARPGGNPAERAGEKGPSDTSGVFSEGGAVGSDRDHFQLRAENAEIEAAHPLRSGRHDLYAEAMRLVGARQSKGDLVDLVTWLLLRCDRATIDLEKGVPLGAFVRVLREHLPSSEVCSEGTAVIKMLRERCAACDITIHSIAGSPLVVCGECLWRARLQREGSLKLANEVTDMFARLMKDSPAKCVGGCGRYAIDGKATCGDVRCGSTTGRGLPGAVPRDVFLRAVQRFDPSIRLPDEKASVPDQKNAVTGEAENKGDAAPKTPPLSDQPRRQCEGQCEARDLYRRCELVAGHDGSHAARGAQLWHRVEPEGGDDL